MKSCAAVKGLTKGGRGHSARDINGKTDPWLYRRDFQSPKEAGKPGIRVPGIPIEAKRTATIPLPTLTDRDWPPRTPIQENPDRVLNQTEFFNTKETKKTKTAFINLDQAGLTGKNFDTGRLAIALAEVGFSPNMRLRVTDAIPFQAAFNGQLLPHEAAKDQSQELAGAASIEKRYLMRLLIVTSVRHPGRVSVSWINPGIDLRQP